LILAPLTLESLHLYSFHLGFLQARYYPRKEYMSSANMAIDNTVRTVYRSGQEELTMATSKTYCARNYRASMVAVHICTGGPTCKGACSAPHKHEAHAGCTCIAPRGGCANTGKDCACHSHGLGYTRAE
jgi:hypothetical protein